MPKKLRVLSVVIGIACAVVAGLIPWLMMRELLPPMSVAFLVGGLCFGVGLTAIFLASGMATEEEVKTATSWSQEFLCATEVANVVNRNRGVGPVDEFHRASPAYVGLILGRLQARGLLEKTVIHSVDKNGRETTSFGYRQWQVAPEYGVDRITGHLRNQPSA